MTIRSLRLHAPTTALALCVILLPFAAGGCNTVHGVGRDVSAGGQAISTAATNVQESLWD